MPLGAIGTIVSCMKRKNGKQHHFLVREDEDPPHCCDWVGCAEIGIFRAPRSPSEIYSYRWFCLGHVRLYNSQWNYYAGMSDEEVEIDIRRDTVWRRPSWPIGQGPRRGGFDPGSRGDPFGFFTDWDSAATEPRGPRPGKDAMAILDLRPPLSISAVKARYKVLVKRHHPDANGGDKASEEKFKQIDHAYRTLIESLAT